MNNLEKELCRYRELAGSWIGKEAQRLKSPCPEMRTEDLQQLAAEPFRWLLNAPVGPNYQPRISGAMSALGSRLAAELQLCAVGVHSAGEYLAVGRCSEIWVSEAALRSSTYTRGLTDRQLTCFLSLYNTVYCQLLGRQHTVVHTLLHGAKDTGCVIEMPLQETALTMEQSSRKCRNLQFKTLYLGKGLPHLCSKELWNRFVPCISAHVAELEAALRQDAGVDEEATRLIGNRITGTLLGNEKVSRDHVEHGVAYQVGKPQRPPWHCFATTFERNRHRAIDAVTSEPEVERAVTELFGESLHSEDEHQSQLVEALRMLQLFFLYQPICGNWFYVIVPRRQEALQMCFTIGSNTRLSIAQLKYLSALAINTRDELSFYFRMTVNEAENVSKLMNEWRDVAEIIGPERREALSKKGLKRATHERMASGGLADYLLFCERISELSVHEGKTLQFDIVVAGGFFASKKLAKLCRFSLDKKRPLWTAVKRGVGGRRQANEEVISRILGNYAFLQEKGVVLFGSRGGHLLYPANALDGTVVPEEFTLGGECYLLRVGKQGDIGVYYDGELVLWRRAGDYLVPELYGQKYRDKLRSWLIEEFLCTTVDPGVVSEVVWNISSEKKGGASFLIGQFDAEGKLSLNSRAYPLTEVFPLADGLPLVQKGSQDLLEQLAIQDGAVAVDIATGKVYGRRQLLPSEAFDWNDHKDEWKTGKWKEWHKVLRWGTRHHSALAFSSGVSSAKRPNGKPSMAVITISSDGDIHVFCGDHPVQDLTYPQPATK